MRVLAEARKGFRTRILHLVRGLLSQAAYLRHDAVEHTLPPSIRQALRKSILCPTVTSFSIQNNDFLTCRV